MEKDLVSFLLSSDFFLFCSLFFFCSQYAPLCTSLNKSPPLDHESTFDSRPAYPVIRSPPTPLNHPQPSTFVLLSPNTNLSLLFKLHLLRWSYLCSSDFSSLFQFSLLEALSYGGRSDELSKDGWSNGYTGGCIARIEEYGAFDSSSFSQATLKPCWLLWFNWCNRFQVQESDLSPQSDRSR